ncbi:MAG: anaerobic ribonucleoside-triphosphate reductase activating protein [Clostridia bacterium]|nr:anaerobic ribonucleoside-triphosphate reductase activating protein [Clostridia bacterium]
MNFNGFQKLTLLDFPGKVACTLFTAGCNFRCPFCHNAGLVTDIDNSTVFPEEQVLEFLEKRKGILEGVCITGGEPLLQPDLTDFIRRVKAEGFCVKLDTNGSYPERLISLAEAGLLDYVAMDVKNCPEKYGATAGVKDFNMKPVNESIDYLLGGKIPFEFRTTVTAEHHTPQDIEAIARRISGAPKYFLQNFVNSGNCLDRSLTPVSNEMLEEMCNKASKYVPFTQIR